MESSKVAIVGLGYVGLPLAVAFGKALEKPVIGFDIDLQRVDELRNRCDRTGETSSKDLCAARIDFTHHPQRLGDADVIIVAVPTPTDNLRRPDYRYVEAASRIIGEHMSGNTVVVFESTVAPGTTEGRCATIIEERSGKKRGTEWWIGYSPERINPGDAVHTLATIPKVVSAENTDMLEKLASLYELIVTAGVHRAPSIMVAETAKACENTQRDLLIAQAGEIALLCRRLGISFHDVRAAAATKWNFVNVAPGIPGGHCIPEDPLFLAECAVAHGIHPELILAGRRRNDAMPAALTDHAIQTLAHAGGFPNGNRVLVYGFTYKPDVRDTRNTKVVDVIARFRTFGFRVALFDPLLRSEVPEAGQHMTFADFPVDERFDIVFIATPHRQLIDDAPWLAACVVHGGVLYDHNRSFPVATLADRSFSYVTL